MLHLILNGKEKQFILGKLVVLQNILDMRVRTFGNFKIYLVSLCKFICSRQTILEAHNSRLSIVAYEDGASSFIEVGDHGR